jgi:dTDP-4-dehydrorhamnose reductase
MNQPNMIFPSIQLDISGVLMYDVPIYNDFRGTLFEAYHILKLRFSSVPASINTLRQEKNVLKVFPSSEFDQLLFTVNGSCDIMFNESCQTSLSCGKIICIPASILFSIQTHSAKCVLILMKSAPLHISQSFPIESPPHFVIMGANGQIGSAFVREILAQNLTYKPLYSRLHQHEAIKNELLSIKPSISVIISAGAGTRPNTRWCEIHQNETVDANVTSQLYIAQVCKELELHCTLIGTAGFYHYDDQHPLGVGFTEEDPPNHLPIFYYQMRDVLEKMIQTLNLDQTVLNLRTLYPFDEYLTTSSILGKLIKFNSIQNIPSSMTPLTTLIPLAIEMMKMKVIGNVNFVAEGVMSNGELLNLYKENVDNNISYNEINLSIEESRNKGNSAAYVVPKRMKELFGNKVPTLEASTKKIISLTKARKNK